MINITYIYLIENIENGTNKVYIGKTKNIDWRKEVHERTYGKQIKFTIIDQIESLFKYDWEPLETYWIEQFRQWGFEVVNKRKKGGSGPGYWTDEMKLKAKNHPTRAMNISKATKGKIRIGIAKERLIKGNKNKNKGKKQTLEHIQKRFKNIIGSKRNSETKKNISKAKKGKRYNITKQGVQHGHFGHKQSEETKRKRSESLKGKPNLKLKGRKHSEETKQKMKEAQIKRYLNKII